MSRLSERLEEERGITFAEFKEKMTFKNSFVQVSYFAHEAGRRSQNCLNKYSNQTLVWFLWLLFMQVVKKAIRMYHSVQ